MSDVAVPTVSKPVLILYVAVLVLLGALVAVWLVQALQSPAGARKPCHGCTDADLGLVVDDAPSEAPGKGA